MPDDNVQPAPAQAEPQKTNIVNVVVLVLGSLGILGGGGGAYLVNDNVGQLQNDMQTTLAVVKTNMTHVTQTVEKLSQQVVDLNEGFQQEFKQHLNDPNLHTQGMAKLREELQKEIEEKNEKLESKLREPMKKQWELIRELKDDLLKLQAWKDALEDQ